MNKLHRTVAILLIICVALGVGFLTDVIWSKVEKWTHPQSYDELIEKYAKEYNIPEYVIYAVIKTESGFDPSAQSSAGAQGLMQMMPSTFEWLTGDEHLREYLPVSSLMNPETSIRYGTYYLRYLYQKFDHNWDTAFAAYNGGEGNVTKWLKDPDLSDGKGNLTNIPFPETKAYVSKVNDAIDTYKDLYYEPNEGVST